MVKSKIFYIVITAAFLSSCGLENMASKYETVSLNTNPKTLETHAGEIAISLDASFPQKLLC